jgi:hypothetical protein
MPEFLNQAIPLFHQHASINTAANGTTTIIAAIAANKRIRLTSLIFVASTAVSITLRSAATDLTGAMAFAANSGINWSCGPAFDTLDMASNEGFVIFTSAAVQVSGWAKFVVAST